jgi:hypothetical protein
LEFSACVSCSWDFAVAAILNLRLRIKVVFAQNAVKKTSFFRGTFDVAGITHSLP